MTLNLISSQNSQIVQFLTSRLTLITCSLNNGIRTLLPVAPITGLPCSGHGICIPGTVHSVQACGTPPVPYSIKIKEWTWVATSTIDPYTALNPLKALVLTNGLPTMTLGDVLFNTSHLVPISSSTCAHVVKRCVLFSLPSIVVLLLLKIWQAQDISDSSWQPV